MRVLHQTTVGLRNLYITLMFLPLWICSAFLRYNPIGWKWLAEHWGLLNVLILLYGALGVNVENQKVSMILEGDSVGSGKEAWGIL